MDIDPRIRLRHLRCFLAIADLGGAAAAAEDLGVTQPAVSKTLRELEEILGAKLFDRSERLLRLNENGRAFRRFASGALAELARGLRAVRGDGRAETVLSIGVLPTAASELAPQATRLLRARFPQCRLRVSTGPNAVLRAHLREGRVDLVIGRTAPPDEMAGLSFEPLYFEDVVLVARPDHPMTRAPVDALPDALAEAELILPPPDALIRPPVEAFLWQSGLGHKMPAYETVSLAFGRQIVLMSNLVWFISRGVVAQELSARLLEAINLRHPMLAGAVGVSMREGQSLSPELVGLVRALREVASDMTTRATGAGAER